MTTPDPGVAPGPSGAPAPTEVPAGLRSFDPTARELLERYHGWLAGAGIERGLIGPREGDRLWDRHILNSAVIEQRVPVGATVADIGSGAGLPGIPLACVRTDVTVTLIEPMQRRVAFLSEVVESLGLTDRVRVVRGRADEVAGQVDRVQAVTGRAVAALAKFVVWADPLLADDGRILAMKGDAAQDEIDAARGALRRARLRVVGISECSVEGLSRPTRVVELCRTA